MNRLFVLFLLLLLSCNSTRLHSSLFFNEALQDSLDLYISQVKGIRNPYKAPTIMDIWINVEEDNSNKKLDTLVFISAVYRIGGPPGYADSDEDSIISYPCDLKGSGFVKGRMCVIKYINNNTFPTLVNEKRLTLPREKFDFFLNYRGPFYDVSISRSSRMYRLDGKNRVVLVEKTRGKFEKE